MTTTRTQRNRLNRQLDEFTKAGELSDEQLVEAFVTEVLNGLDTGSREEALAEELVERFSAVVGIEVKQ